MGKINLIYKKLKKKLIREIRKPFLIAEGKKQVRELASKMQQDDVYVILPSLIGDFCYAMAYMRDFCRQKQDEGKTVTVFLLEARKPMLELWTNNFKTVFFPKGSKEYGRIANIICHKETVFYAQKYNIYATVPWYAIPHNGKNLRNGFDILRNDMLQIGNDAAIEYPKVPKVKVKAIPDFELRKGRVVVMNPYSNSMGYMDITIYEEMASILRKKGYEVYTNVVGDQQPVKGSQPLDCPIFELYNICNEIPLFISIRSGIIDFCVSAKCKLFIISFGLRKFMTNDFYYTYELKYWQTGNVTEFIHKSKEDTLARFSAFVKDMKDYND